MDEKRETRTRSLRIANDVWEAIQGLPGKTDDALREVLIAGEKATTPGALGAAIRVIQRDVAHVLELVQGMLGVEDIEEAVVRAIEEYKAGRLGSQQKSAPDGGSGGGGSSNTAGRAMVDWNSPGDRQAAGLDALVSSIPGVQVGMSGLRPPRETGAERVARERREREQRALALDKSGGDRDDIDRSDEFVSG